MKVRRSRTTAWHQPILRRFGVIHVAGAPILWSEVYTAVMRKATEDSERKRAPVGGMNSDTDGEEDENEPSSMAAPGLRSQARAA